MALTAAISAASTEAQGAALRHFSANLRALVQSQPDLIAAVRRPDVEYSWVYGRDGSLTALSPAGGWLADCSLPYRAATAMLKSVESRGAVACMLAPVHGAQVRRALELLSHQQALLVLSPDEAFLSVALHCHDFSAAIEDHRLFFAVGANWSAQLAGVFSQYPGLPIPSLFLRPPTTPDAVSQPLIETAQRIFGDASVARNVLLSSLSRDVDVKPSASQRRRVCVVAPAAYRLWGDGASVVADLLSSHPSFDVRRLDPERPTTSSQLSLAAAARECDVLITTDFARSGVPAEIVPNGMPWLTWATTPNVPDGRRAAPQDRLIVADAGWLEAAMAEGWQRSQISAAGWPVPDIARAGSAAAGLAILADTEPLRTDIDEDTFEFSSHMVLWEMIAGELQSNPLLASEDPDGYLTSRMARLSIGPEGFNRALFLSSLVGPAYQQGLARALIGAGLAVRLFGRGWGDISEFAPYAMGPVASREDLVRAAATSAALVRATAGRHPHPISALNRPVITPAPGPMDDLVRAARAALSAKGGVRGTGPSLTADVVMALLG